MVETFATVLQNMKPSFLGYQINPSIQSKFLNRRCQSRPEGKIDPTFVHSWSSSQIIVKTNMDFYNIQIHVKWPLYALLP